MWLLYLIEILHQTTTLHRLRYANARLYLIEILHQTTTLPSASRSMACCILSKFYIKPQLIPRSDGAGYVVSYRNSTSNHNSSAGWRTPAGLYLIEILHQTTTARPGSCWAARLYLIEILHQTTTRRAFIFTAFLLYLIEILHQTTTNGHR